MPERKFDVAVIGLGAMGAAALYQLAKLGVNAVGIDRYAPPHDQGSSHGDTRITRLAVGEGAQYIPLVSRSHQIWRELEASNGVSLFEQCGVLMMTSSEMPTRHHGIANFTEQTIALAKQYGIAHDVLTGTDIRARFPQFGPVRHDAVGYFEAEGGYVRPERCIAAQVQAAQALGAQVITGSTVTHIASDGGNATLSIRSADALDQSTIVADKVIVCAGMWSADLLGEPLRSLLKVCRQTLFWFKVETPSIFPAVSPSFILSHGPTEADICYGFPPIPGEGSMKIATEQYKGLDSIAALERTVSKSEADAMYRSHVDGHIAGLTPELIKASVCTYTVTPDHGFIVDDHPQLTNVIVVSACSGHGFKHSAAIGEAVAQKSVRGRNEIDLSAFSLKRFVAH